MVPRHYALQCRVLACCPCFTWGTDVTEVLTSIASLGHLADERMFTQWEPADRGYGYTDSLKVSYKLYDNRTQGVTAYHRRSVCFHLTQDIDAGGKKIVYAYRPCCR